MSLGPTSAQRQIDQTIQKYNSKTEILTAIVKHRAAVSGNLGHLHIASVDPRGDHILVFYHPPPTHDVQKVQLKIEPPLKSPWEFKPLLERWEALAKKAYEIPERPPIKYYSLPPPFPLTIPIIFALSALAFAHAGRGYYADAFRALIEKYFGKYMIIGSECFTAFMHLLSEPAWMFILLRRHQTPWSEGWKWMLTVMLLGSPGINEFNDCVEYEKLSHIYARTEVGPLPPRLERHQVEEKKKTE